MTGTLLGFVIGAVTWTLVEYIIHRPLGHHTNNRVLMYREHQHHHTDILYFTPIPMKIRGAAPVILVLGVAAYFVVGLGPALGFVIAVSSGWTLYEWLHQAIHVKGPRSWYSRWAAKNHLAHHFNRATKNFGVTTPLWDYIFGSHEHVERVRIKRQQLDTIAWLKAADAAGNAVVPAFLADYDIR